MTLTPEQLQERMEWVRGLVSKVDLARSTYEQLEGVLHAAPAAGERGGHKKRLNALGEAGDNLANAQEELGDAAPTLASLALSLGSDLAAALARAEAAEAEVAELRERVQALESTRVGELEAALKAMTAWAERYRGALEWYADLEKWDDETGRLRQHVTTPGEPWGTPEVDLDWGQRARAALGMGEGE